MQKNIFSLFVAVVLLVGLVFPSGTSAVTLPSGDKATATMDPNLLEEMKHNIGLIEVIVSFHGNEAPTFENVELLRNLGIDSGITMQALPIAGVLATSSQIEALSKDKSVRSLYLNRKVHLYNADSKEITGVTKVRTDDAMRKANGGLPVSGKGIGVIINDTGIDGNHPDLKLGKNLVQNVMGTHDINRSNKLLPIQYVEDVPDTDTASGHGTHVAGTVGGTGVASSGKYAGVAPGANLIGYGSGAVDLAIYDVLSAFDYALVNQFKYNIRVINNSWGTLGNSSGFDLNDPVNIASKFCYDRGIVVVFAAGNEGPAEDTHNIYAKAPWIISVAAGKKDATLVEWSSRGTKGGGGTFSTPDGKVWSWEDEPTVTAPGYDIISARVHSAYSVQMTQEDLEQIEPAYYPYYSLSSGTSMASPHVAGIVALMLEANPTLSPDEVKEILRKTATNMPGRESWEVGAGYVNAHAAVDMAFNQSKVYGETSNKNRIFNSVENKQVLEENISINFDPVDTSNNSEPFKVEKSVGELTVKISAYGYTGIEGNTVNLIVKDPMGNEYRYDADEYFFWYTDRFVIVENPIPGTWTVIIEALNGVALPEVIEGKITQKLVTGYTGINDVFGHSAEAAVKLAVKEHIIDSYTDGNYKPDNLLTRNDLADYLVMGAGIRQVAQTTDNPAIEAVTARGAALKGKHYNKGVMLFDSDGSFNGERAVTRGELAYSLIQSLGLQAEAQNHTGDVTVDYKGESIVIEDTIPADLKGYVQLAIDLGIMNVYYSTTQGPYDLEPTIHANFKVSETVTRGDYAVAITRFFNVY